MSSPLGSPGAGRLGGGTISFEAARGNSAPGDGDRDGRGCGVRDGAATLWGRTGYGGVPPPARDGGTNGDTRDGGDGGVTDIRGGGLDASRGAGDDGMLRGRGVRVDVVLGLGFGFARGLGGGPATVRTDVAESDS